MIKKIPAFLAVIFAALFSFTSIAAAQNLVVNQPSNVEPEIIVTLADFERAVTASKTVKRKPVTFKNQNLKMAGLIFFRY
jgi:hypothetical protein